MSRLLFLGTPEAAVPALRAIADDVGLVITQPDRPRGRSRTPVPPPVKEAATALGLEVAQPRRSADLAVTIAAHGEFTLGVVVAFGMLLRPDALAAIPAGFVNVHFSVLPRWRGAAPVQRTLLAGDTRAGVSLMRLDQGLDTGPILATRSTAIGADEDAGGLTTRLAETGARLLADLLPAVVAGAVVAVPQDHSLATTAPKIETDDARIDVEAPAGSFVALVRAMAPRPGAFATVEGERIRVLAARDRGTVGLDPGELALVDRRLLSGTATTSVELVSVQPAGRRVMTGVEWARGRRGDLGRLE